MSEKISDENFQKLIKDTGFGADNSKIDKFKKYFEMLIETNQNINLTAITDYNDVLIKHFTDSLLVKNCIDKIKEIKPIENSNIIDIGTGAGFPGLPLAIMCPEAKFTLVDSLGKRIRFIEDVANALGLKNVTAIHSRSEELGQNKSYREKFELALSRAVADIAVLSEYTLPFVRQEGFFIAYKSSNIDEELESGKKAIKRLGGEILTVKDIMLPGTDILRRFVCIKKEGITPSKYPRKPGTPSKKPIKS